MKNTYRKNDILHMQINLETLSTFTVDEPVGVDQGMKFDLRNVLLIKHTQKIINNILVAT